MSQRTLGRRKPKIVEAKGPADLDALAAFLQDRSFLVADHPTTADTTVVGPTAPVLYWDMETPVAAHARSLSILRAYCDRMRQRCFREAHGTGSASPKTVA